MLAASRLGIAEIPGEEADDIVATIAVQAAARDITVLIASQDKDFCQIVTPRINLLRPDPPDAPPMDAKAVLARYGVNPEQIVDFLSLVGDSVDNIPGVPGIGEKTAVVLLHRYGTIDNLLAHAQTLDKPRLRAPLQAAAERLRANRELIRLHTDIPLPWSLNDFKVQTPDETRLRELFARRRAVVGVVIAIAVQRRHR
jgi:DNA polymerase-1